MVHVRRREFLIAAGLLLTIRHAGAQPTRKIHSIGLLYYTPGRQEAALVRGLREFGYIEGQNILIQRRTANGQLERLSNLAIELVQLGVEVIVATDPPSTNAAAAATKTIPIVMRTSNDPAESGLVVSLAHPGANITGVYSLSAEIAPKRLELLKDAVPGLTHVGILWDDRNSPSVPVWKQAQAAAKALGLKVKSLRVHRQEDLNDVFSTASKAHVEALIVLRNPLFIRLRTQLVALTNTHRIPAIYDEREFVDAGGLMAYGANLNDLTMHAARYVDQILKGANPADLAIEQPTKFELLINLKAAKAIGFSIPRSFLLRADEVVN